MRPERFIAAFAITFLALFGLLLAPFLRPLISAFSHGLVSAAAFWIHIFGGHASVEGTVLRAPSGFAIEMKDGCNGANVTILLWSAVIAFPAMPLQKAKGLFWGALIVQSVNLIRFVSLFYLGQYNLSLFEFAHEYLWESLIMLDGLLFFGFWVHGLFRESQWKPVAP